MPQVTTTTPQKHYVINGEDFSTLEQFYETVSNVIIPGAQWGHNLDAFNDILRGGFGTPREGFTLIWQNSELSKQRLGYDETVRQLQIRLARCHPQNIEDVNKQLARARNRVGDTVFDWLVGIIRSRCTRDYGEGHVELVLD